MVEDDLRRVQNVRTDSARAWLRREPFEVTTAVSARRQIIATEVGAGVATEAALRFVFRLAVHGIADQHTETLYSKSSMLPLMDSAPTPFQRTGLKAVTVPFRGAI
jgi:hypothetical protein